MQTIKTIITTVTIIITHTRNKTTPTTIPIMANRLSMLLLSIATGRKCRMQKRLPLSLHVK